MMYDDFFMNEAEKLVGKPFRSLKVTKIEVPKVISGNYNTDIVVQVDGGNEYIGIRCIKDQDESEIVEKRFH